MVPLAERARKILLHEQRTNHADVAVMGGLASFFSRWASDAASHPQAQRLAAMFADYATLDPMQRVARVRSALALLADVPPPSKTGERARGRDTEDTETRAE